MPRRHRWRVRPASILQQRDHRPWPVPPGGWLMRMAWHDLLFLHWKVEVVEMRRHVPRGLEVDTFDERAWIGVVPFRMTDVAPRNVPGWTPFSSFPEINVRTYVVADGKPGVWFFSLDVPDALPVWIARKFYHLPYFKAAIAARWRGEHYEYDVTRGNRRFAARYRPVAEVERAKPGTFAHWATERYCLYAQRDADGAIFRTDVLHEPWPLQRAAVEIEHCAMHDVAIGAQHPDVFFSRRIDVLSWQPEAVG